MRLCRFLGLTAVLLLQLASTKRSLAIVLNFDDLEFDTVLSGGTYGGLTWEQGNPGDLGYPGVWAVPPSFGHSYPHSSSKNIFNGNGSTLIGISFPSPVNASGVYVAVQGNGQSAWALGLHVHGYLDNQFVGDATPLTSITTTPSWLDMSALMNVDRIVFEAQPPSAVEAYYGLDDLTFTYVPEPAGISLGLMALGGMLLRRRCPGRP
jgi:hypothetical protein